MFHRCWIEFLDGWAERTRDATNLTWADGVERSTRIFLGGLLGDQQEGDKFTAEPCVCHRCFAARKDYLEPDAPAQVKSSKRMRLKVEAAAAGAHLPGARDKWVVKWDPDGRNVRPGPGTWYCTVLQIMKIIKIFTIVIILTKVSLYPFL